MAVAAIVGAFFAYRVYESRRPFAPLSEVRTLAGNPDNISFGDPFGIAIGADDTVYVSDGERGCIWRIAPNEGTPTILVENLNTPSGVAIAPDGTLVIAETGAHTIKRFNSQTNQLTTIAGVAGRAGLADGRRSESLFNAPIGLTVGSDSMIYVADTYNDCIRVIDVARDEVRTLAGDHGVPGYMDAASGQDARFDTPCGIVVARDGALIVADTGNNRLRRIEMSGATTTLAGTGEATVRDGAPFDAAFDEPIGITTGVDNTLYITDAGGAAVRECSFGENAGVRTLAGGSGRGVTDGSLDRAQFNYPSSIAIFSDGALVVADAGNRLVRAFVGERRMRGAPLARENVGAMRVSVDEFRAASEGRWPFDPPQRKREIAATFGEIRGELKPDGNNEAWFHNGLDITGALGETVRAVRGERVLRPLIVASVGTARERIRLPSIGYVHLRVGRFTGDRAFDDERFIISRDERNRVTRVRVRRGTRFAASDALGTLNEQYHVHLIAGTVGAEWNALAALSLPGVEDSVAPTIEDVQFVGRNGEAFSSPNARTRTDPVTVHGDVRIIARVYDQMNGNAARRRLGLYRLGYQILDATGAPAAGDFTEPRMTLSFETLPEESAFVPFVYAPPSRSGYSSDTIFAYIVTNRVHEREAIEDFWRASTLASGEYTVRVFAEDFFGNRATRDVTVRVSTETTAHVSSAP